MNRPKTGEGATERGEIAAEWCLRTASGPLRPDEQARCDAWLAEQPENAVALQRARELWRDLHELRDTPEIISKRSEALEALRRANRARWSRLARPNRWMFALAASLVLLVTSTVLLVGGGGHAYQTGIGERRTIVLEDGSRLSLDADTAVDVRLSGDRRALHLLRGRAKFDVEKDPTRPFSVSAGGRTAIATGTAFSVELLDGQLHVIVYEGSVAVVRGEPSSGQRLLDLKAHPNPLLSTRLFPGSELVAINEGTGAAVSTADIARSLSWEGGQLDFVDEPLSDAVARLNRYNKDRIVIGDDKAAAILVNGVFNAGDSAAFVEALSRAYPIRVTTAGGEIVLASKR